MPKFKDLKGQRFGRLTVIECVGKNKQGNYMWLCQCDCGNTCIVVGSNFSRKNRPTRSCGCLAKEINSEKMKKKNEEWWQDENYREKKIEQASEQMKKKWQEDEEFRKMQSKKTRKLNEEQWQDEERKQKHKEMMEQRWSDEEYREAHSGKNCHWYNLDLTDEQRKENESRSHDREWVACATRVKKRDNNTCQCCGHQQEKGMIAHHKNGWDNFKEQRYDDNVVTLCECCHKEFHHTYGYGDNTKEQYEKFKQSKQENLDSKTEEIA